MPYKPEPTVHILKETKAEKIYETIQDTLNGGAVMSPSIAVKALQLLKINGNVRSDDTTPEIILSDRETEILEQLAKGQPISELPKSCSSHLLQSSDI
ncbi:hypothetical protein MASR1M65_05100 [Saprospiraceae bacterium]